MNDLASRLRLFDRALAELRAASTLLAGVPESMRALHDEYSAERAALETLAEASREAAVARRDADGAVADAQEKLKKFQQQVSRVRNQREYGAILSEIDQAKSGLKTLDEAALAALERAESLARELDERRSAFADLEARYSAELARWEAEKPSVAAKVAGLERDLESLRGELPKPVIAQFLRIVERYHGVAMARLDRTERPGGGAIWHCGCCNYQIRPQVAVEIRTKGTIVQCDNCRRFLFAEGEG